MPATGEAGLRAFREARNAALRSLEEWRIRAYCRRYGVPIPADRGPDGPFWAGVHKARLECLDLTEAERETSRRWLAARGYRPGVL